MKNKKEYLKSQKQIWRPIIKCGRDKVKLWFGHSYISSTPWEMKKWDNSVIRDTSN
jgi:hypothetical protein